MQIVKQSHEILYPKSVDQATILFDNIEQIARVCYKSEDKITPDSKYKFVQMLLDKEHMAMLEHNMMSVKFITDRGISHELVRHRLASFAQESTRYVNYKEGIQVICPFESDADEDLYEAWYNSAYFAEKMYAKLVMNGVTPQIARSVLPNCLKTEIVITANWREWRHIFKLRTASTAHPQMQSLMKPLLEEIQNIIPLVFDDIS